ncbi:MAG: ribosomal protein S18-alanine N-acetyltransferase [Myxococcota bacterium]
MGPDRDADRPEVTGDWIVVVEPFGGDTRLELRTGGLEDVATVEAIEAVAHPTPWTTAIFEREMELDWSHIWVVDSPEADRVVAFLVFWTIHDEVHILNVAVHPDSRRRGIASQLIDRLESRARELDFAFITLEVRENNAPAIRLYESMGFQATGRREEYYADTGEAALLMHRLI